VRHTSSDVRNMTVVCALEILNSCDVRTQPNFAKDSAQLVFVEIICTWSRLSIGWDAV
jgi:hypothetical protein